jgi:hypothetical protein
MALQLWVDLVEDLRLLHGHVRVGGGEVHPHQPATDALLYRKRRPAKRQISSLIFFISFYIYILYNTIAIILSIRFILLRTCTVISLISDYDLARYSGIHHPIAQ